MNTENNFGKLSYNIKDFVSYTMRNYFTLSQENNFKGFEVKRGDKTVLEINPNSYNKGKLNDFAEKLGLRERQLKSQIENLKQNYQLQYDDVPAEIPLSVDLQQLENQLKEIVECASIISLLRHEFINTKARIENFNKTFSKQTIDKIIEASQKDPIDTNYRKQLIDLQTKYGVLNSELKKENAIEFVYPPFKSEIITNNAPIDEAKDYVKASILSKLDATTQLEYHQATSFIAIYKQLSKQYARLESTALEGELGCEQTIKVQYLTGHGQYAQKDTKTTAKVLVSKKELRDRTLSALTNHEHFEQIVNLVDEQTDQMLKKMQEEVLRQKKSYEEEKNQKFIEFQNNKRNTINQIKDKIDLLSQQFKNLENTREYNHLQEMNLLEQDYAKNKAIVPIADFTNKVINALA